MHQTGYNDTMRRELICENLTNIILDTKLTNAIIVGDMNVAPPGGRDGYSRNPTTARQRKVTDDGLLDFSEEIGGTLVSPSGPTWRRGDDTQSATLDHLMWVNFPDMVAEVTSKVLGDIQHDHL
jgi:hypothetical protein